MRHLAILNEVSDLKSDLNLARLVRTHFSLSLTPHLARLNFYIFYFKRKMWNWSARYYELIMLRNMMELGP